MSASVLSGGSAPSFVPSGVSSLASVIGPNGATPIGAGIASQGGTTSSSLVVQQLAGVQQPVVSAPGAPTSTAASTSSSSLWIGEPPFSTVFPGGVATPTTQGSFLLTVPNATAVGGGAPEGCLTLYSYANAAFNNAVLQVPKPNTAAGQGDDMLQFLGGSQSGQSTIIVGAVTSATSIVNAAVTANSIILCSLASGAATQAGAYFATIVAGTGFTVSSTVAVAGANAVVNYFVVKY